MGDPVVHHIKIANFKSIDTLKLNKVGCFSAFVGANGCGKSNFFDALDFVNRFIRRGVQDALAAHGGYETIRCVKRYTGYSERFEFEINCTLPLMEKKDALTKRYNYRLKLHDLNKKAAIEEKLIVDGQCRLDRRWHGPFFIDNEEKAVDSFSPDNSGLLNFSNIPVVEFLRNIRLYRIEPKTASSEDRSDQSSYVLQNNGRNLPSVLKRLEKDKQLREEISEWMEAVVPGLEKISTKQQALTGNTEALFKETGTGDPFPARMVSDGTIFVLCLLVAVLDTPSQYGLAMIEEPERGLHPKAISELINMIREKSSTRNMVWLTSHSEPVVRQLNLDEFWLVDKLNGRTQMKLGSDGNLKQDDLHPLGMDEAWLSNLLGGGLPW
ncbi:MAG: AAA family ATPase [Desulfobacterales bacterium]|nr:AAA family ATPase [Desulfobacterales bacterium]